MPRTYTDKEREKAVKAVIAGLTKGTPLTIICKPDSMPCANTIRDWANDDPDLAGAIAHAREAGFDQIAMDALRIADEADQDTIETDAGERPNSEWITRSRLRVDTRLKLLAKWDPKRYGDATLVKHADADGEKLPLDDVAKMTRLASIADAIRRNSDDGSGDATELAE